MALNKSYDVAIDSLVASAFQSSVYEAFLNLQPRDFNPAAAIGFDSLSGNGSLVATFDFAAVSASGTQWTNALTFDSQSAASLQTTKYYDTANDQAKPILPLCRVRVTARSTDANTATFAGVIAKLLVEQ